MLVKTKDKGFTLIELSIVIVIIGLIIAGVVGGQSLVRQAKIRSIISEYNEVKLALNAFKLEYDAIPGDMNNAVAYGIGANNGNGNKQIVDRLTEALYAWEHLANAELYKGSYTGLDAGDIDYVAGVNIPPSSFGNNVGLSLGYIGITNSCHSAASSPLFGVINNQNVLYVGALESLPSSCPRDGFLKVSEAHGIDNKIDDGLADSGLMYARNTHSTNVDGNRCVDNATNGTGGASYDFDETGESCALIFNIDK